MNKNNRNDRKRQIIVTYYFEETLLEILIPQDATQLLLRRILHKPTSLDREVERVVFRQRIILLYSHLFCNYARKSTDNSPLFPQAAAPK